MVASCPKCGYAANLEKATSTLEPVQDLKASGNGSPELVHTPGMKTIEEVAKYLGVSPKQKIKTLALVGMWITEEGKRLEWPIAVFVRGDHMLNEAKLLAVTGAREVRPMHGEEIQSICKAPGGFLGPVGLDMEGFNAGGVEGRKRVSVDKALKGRSNLCRGRNKEDNH